MPTPFANVYANRVSRSDFPACDRVVFLGEIQYRTLQDSFAENAQQRTRLFASIRDNEARSAEWDTIFAFLMLAAASVVRAITCGLKIFFKNKPTTPELRRFPSEVLKLDGRHRQWTPISGNPAHGAEFDDYRNVQYSTSPPPANVSQSVVLPCNGRDAMRADWPICLQ